MSGIYLKVTFSDGKPLAAYLQLPRQSGDRAVKSKKQEAGLVVDFASDGRPIGVEITSPSLFSVDAMNRVLVSLNLSPLAPGALAPLAAA